MKENINPIIKAIIPLAEGISKTFGSNCEVIVHDLSHPKTSIIKIFNSTVTERNVGEGIRVPVIDVSLAALSYAEFLVDLRIKHGWYFSKKNEYLSPPLEEIKACKLSKLF